MNDMFGTNSCALSGRTDFPTRTQGIARARSALGCILVAFQATAQPNHLNKRQN